MAPHYSDLCWMAPKGRHLAGTEESTAQQEMRPDNTGPESQRLPPA